MEKIISIFLVLFLNICGHAQTIDLLDEKNGFRGLKLGSLVSDYPELVRKNSENYDLFHVNYRGIPYTGYGDYYLSKPCDLYRNLDKTEIMKIFVQSYEDKVEEIRLYLILTPSLLEYFELAFGKPNFTDCKCINNPNAMQIYNWVGENVSLSINSVPQNNLAIVTFRDRNLSFKRTFDEENMRVQEKEKKLKDAKSDF